MDITNVMHCKYKYLYIKQNTNNFTEVRQKEGKLKFPQCKTCKHYTICEGPWNDYPMKRGDKEFQPII